MFDCNEGPARAGNMEKQQKQPFSPIHDTRFQNYLDQRARFARREDQQGLPEYGSLARFAAACGISKLYLSQVNCRRKQIGDRTARQMELGLKLDHGHMDRDHTTTTSSSGDRSASGNAPHKNVSSHKHP